jgi:hypothetical protein
VQRRPRAIPPQYEALLEEEASWDTLRRHIVENEELTPELRDQALEAVAELQPLLGDSWPYDVYGTEHPMAQCLANWAPHAVAELVRTTRMLREIQALTGWRQLAGKLTSAAEAPGALLEMNVASRALRAGMHVTLSPHADNRRQADALVRSHGESLYVEARVSKAFPERTARIDRTEHRIIPILHLHASNIAFGGRLAREPDDEEATWLEMRVAAFLHQVRASGSPRVLLVPGLLELCCVRRDDPAFERYEALGLVGTFQGIPFEWSPLRKLVLTAWAKSGQLPADSAGLLVITPPSFLGKPPPPNQLVASLRAALLQMPHVVAIALLWRDIVPAAIEESRVIDGNAVFTQTPIQAPAVERVLFVPSPLAADRLGALNLACALMCAGYSFNA